MRYIMLRAIIDTSTAKGNWYIFWLMLTGILQILKIAADGNWSTSCHARDIIIISVVPKQLSVHYRFCVNSTGSTAQWKQNIYNIILIITIIIL